MEVNLTTSELAALKRRGHEGYAPTKWVVANLNQMAKV